MREPFDEVGCFLGAGGRDHLGELQHAVAVYFRVEQVFPAGDPDCFFAFFGLVEQRRGETQPSGISCFELFEERSVHGDQGHNTVSGSAADDLFIVMGRGPVSGEEFAGGLGVEEVLRDEHGAGEDELHLQCFSAFGRGPPGRLGA